MKFCVGLRPSGGLEFVRPALVILVALMSASSAFAQKELTVSAIQGPGIISPYENTSVRISGIVTARTRTGFFVQSPDDRRDADPGTSEGIFVFTKTEPGAEATVGNLVSLTGVVEEFRPRSEPATLSVTEIVVRNDRDSIKVLSSQNELPKSVTLTLPDFAGNRIEQLEKYEGMRVSVDSATVVAPTDGRVDIRSGSSASNGTFFAVVKGLARPFREPGLDYFEFAALTVKERERLKTVVPRLALFDANPERLRIESAGQLGAQALDVPAFAELRGLAGVLHYSYRTNTILLDVGNKPVVTSTIRPIQLPRPTDRQFSIAGMNLENFFDDEDDPAIKEDIVIRDAFEKRLAKISIAVRDVMRSPDVIGVVEAENLRALKRLADKINSDSVASGSPDPKYAAYLFDGNDGRGIDNGFLVKSSRVSVIETKQFGQDVKFKNATTGESNFLNDRPPLMLRVGIPDAKTGRLFEITVVVNHLKSFLGYNDPRQQDNVRWKRRLQAEFLAKFINDRQKADPAEKIILIGDFNAFPFNDGVMDPVGTIKGAVSAPETLINPSEDLVERDLINLVDLIDVRQRYSYIFDGNAQVLDHIIVGASLKKHSIGFGFARVNADYPEVFRNDASRPERFSDHDPAIGYFSLDEKPDAGSSETTTPTTP